MASKRSLRDNLAESQAAAEAKATSSPAPESRIEREGAKRLARVGGSEPDLETPPRRRSNPA
jgi:hypothetical protein